LGHSLVASNNGDLVFVDYSASSLVGDGGNFIDVQFLDSALDDVAPLVGAGSSNNNPVPEPVTGVMGLGALGALCLSLKRRR